MTEVERWRPALDLDTIRSQLAPEATDAELEHFALVCRHLDLDPFAGQICLIPRNGVHRPQITVAGRRAIAFRTGRLRGIDGPYWTGPRDADGALTWLDLWTDDDEPPYAARCLVHAADWDTVANGTVKWSEFAQTTTDRQGRSRLTAVWARMPSHMLGKVAESLALRRAFPEIQQAVSYVAAAMGDVETDDFASVAEAEAEASVAAGSVGAAPPIGPVQGSGSAPKARTTGRADLDRVPDWVRDESPEARGYR